MLWGCRARARVGESRCSGGPTATASAIRWIAGLAIALAAAGAWAEAGGGDVSRVVVYLSSEDPNEPAHIADFRKEFERRVLPRHPRTRLEVHQVNAFEREPMVAKLKELAARESPPVLFIAHSMLAQVAVQETPELPVVHFTMADPVALGIVDRPLATSTNVTGHTSYVRWELKHVELLRDAVPGIRKVGVISDSFWFDWGGPARLVRESEALLGVKVKPVLVGVVSQIEDIRAAAPEVDAWYLPDTPFNRLHGKRIRELITASGKPSISATPLRSPDAHLLAYVRESNALPWERLADIVGLVLSGVRAGDIPFDAPRKFRLMVSLSTARRLGIEVPRSVLMRANEVLP